MSSTQGAHLQNQDKRLAGMAPPYDRISEAQAAIDRPLGPLMYAFRSAGVMDHVHVYQR